MFRKTCHHHPATLLAKITAIFGIIIVSTFPGQAPAASVDLKNGFIDHGVAAPISNHRGTVATVDGNGRNVVLSLMMDHRGGYALLMVDAETGNAQQFPIPFDNVKNDSPYSSILSSKNKFYTHFGDHFIEFDPAKPGFTFSSKTAPQMAMGMTEDDNGVIWSVTYPDSGVVAFNPETREFRDYGHVHDEDWAQYQRFVAADDKGWIYFAVGHTDTQIVAFDGKTSTATPLLAEDQRAQGGTSYVFRAVNGKVYGQALRGDSPWFELYEGKATPIDKPAAEPKPIITDTQALVHTDFPDGTKIVRFDLVERTLTISEPGSGENKTVKFDYTSEGAILMGVAPAPNGTIVGGTAFPMRSYSYDPKTDTMSDRAAYGQWNTIEPLNDKMYVGGYPRGYILEWEPAKPWVPTVKGNADSNPEFFAEYKPTINRPHALLPLSDGSQVIMGGTPDYGYTGGGLVFWDLEKSSGTLLKDTDVIPDQSTMSLEELPNGKILGGSTTAPGTGGQKKANLAVLYIMDVASKKIEWQGSPIAGVQTYTDLYRNADGLIYGVADRKIFFVFDAEKRQVVYQKDVSGEFGITASEQGPRIFVPAGERLFVIFADSIVEVDKNDYKLKLVAKSPETLKSGGAFMDGRIYVGTSSHVLSYDLGQSGFQKDDTGASLLDL